MSANRLLPFTVVAAVGVFTGIYIFKGEFQELEKEKQEYHVDSVAQLPADPSARESKEFAALHQSPSPSFETLRNGPEAGLAAARSKDDTNTENIPLTHTTRRSIWDYLQPGDARNRRSSSGEPP
ncbi:MAG: hypothetical protein Q9214_001874 [Letrouitia sp. 1 TL-2023]